MCTLCSTYVYICTHLCLCMLASIHVHAYNNIHAYVCTYVLSWTHAYILQFIRISMYTVYKEVLSEQVSLCSWFYENREKVKHGNASVKVSTQYIFNLCNRKTFFLIKFSCRRYIAYVHTIYSGLLSY